MAPGSTLREAIVDIRAIWDCRQNGTPLNFKRQYDPSTRRTISPDGRQRSSR